MTLRPTRDIVAPYQTLQRISPPTPVFAAWRPVMTPREVDRMLMPSPP